MRYCLAPSLVRRPRGISRCIPVACIAALTAKDAADLRVMQTITRAKRLEGFAFRSVVRHDRRVAVRTGEHRPGRRSCWRATLHSGHFGVGVARHSLLSGPGNEGVIAKIDLVRRPAPIGGLSRSACHEVDVGLPPFVASPERRNGWFGAEPRGRRCEPDSRSIATPRPLRRISDDSGAHRIQHDVARELDEVSLALGEDGVIATLVDVPDATMTLVEMLRETAVEMLHPANEVAGGRFLQREQQMVMICHEAVRVKCPTVTLARRTEESEEGLAVVVIAIDRLTSVAACSDMVECPWDVEAKWTRHNGGR